MFKQTRAQDLTLFVNLAHITPPQTRAQIPTYVLIPAFIMSELKTAFEIGFLIFLPFLLIDLIVSSTLMSHGDDHVASFIHIAAVQDPAVRSGRRLGPDHALAGRELPLTWIRTQSSISQPRR